MPGKFDPDAYINAHSGFDPDAYLKAHEKAPPAVSQTEAAVRGGAQGATLGFADEIAGGALGLKDYLQAKLGKRGDIGLGDAYRTNRDAIRLRDEAAANQNPWSYGLAEGAGGLAIPGGSAAKGATMAPKIGRAALFGGAVGAGTSSADLTNSPKEIPAFGSDVALGSLFGGAGHLAGEAVGAAKDVVAPKVADYLGNIAKERAVKATTGESAKYLKKFAKTPAQGGQEASQALSNIRNAGEQLLAKDEAGGAVIPWFGNKEKLANRAEAKKDFYGRKIGDVGKSVDEAAAKKGVAAIPESEITDNIAAYRESVPEYGQGDVIKNRLSQEEEKFKKGGDGISFAEGAKARNAYKLVPQSADALISNQDATNKLNDILRQSMNRSVEQHAPESFGDYIAAKNKYGVMRTAEDAGNNNIESELRRRFISPSTHGVGAAAGIMAAAKHASNPAIAAITLASGAGNEFAKNRGSAFVARSANAISNALAGKDISKWQSVLATAAKRGPQALVSTHHLLMNNDPEYRALMEERSNGTSGNPD